MQNFAFMIHPMDVGDVARKFKLAKYLPQRALERAFETQIPPEVYDAMERQLGGSQ